MQIIFGQIEMYRDGYFSGWLWDIFSSISKFAIPKQGLPRWIQRKQTFTSKYDKLLLFIILIKKKKAKKKRIKVSLINKN